MELWGLLMFVSTKISAKRRNLDSNTMTADFCVAALHEALAIYGPPEIFNSDQGSQFTSDNFTKVLKEAEVAISMDGVGRGTAAMPVAPASPRICATTTKSVRTVRWATRHPTRSTMNHASTSGSPEPTEINLLTS